jgi:P27 family predicted phage terminase small subunit
MECQTLPPAPAYLSEDARAKWDEVWGKVDRTLIRPDTHGETVAVYVTASADFERATRQINASGLLLNDEGRIIANPLYALRTNAQKNMLEAASALGLNRTVDERRAWAWETKAQSTPVEETDEVHLEGLGDARTIEHAATEGSGADARSISG